MKRNYRLPDQDRYDELRRLISELDKDEEFEEHLLDTFEEIVIVCQRLSEAVDVLGHEMNVRLTVFAQQIDKAFGQWDRRTRLEKFTDNLRVFSRRLLGPRNDE